MPRETVRDKILATAGDLFYEKGYNLTGIDEVIEKADIARGSLYYHFKSKTELLLSYLDAYQLEWWMGLEAHLKSIRDPKKRLLAVFDYRIESQERRNFGGCAFIKINDEAGATDKRILKKVQTNKDKLQAFLLEMVSLIRHKKILSDEELAQALYFLMEGSVNSTAVYKTSNELKKAKKIASRLL